MKKLAKTGIFSLMIAMTGSACIPAPDSKKVESSEPSAKKLADKKASEKKTGEKTGEKTGGLADKLADKRVIAKISEAGKGRSLETFLPYLNGQFNINDIMRLVPPRAGEFFDSGGMFVWHVQVG